MFRILKKFESNKLYSFSEHSKIEDINKYLPKQIRAFGLKRVTKGFNSKGQCNARTYTYTFPTFAFAPDDPSIVAITPTDEDIQKRIEKLSVIDGKPFTDFRMTPELLEKIRKMMALAIGVVRNLISEETLEECYKPEKREVPTAPSLGLVLNHVHYDTYNRRYGSDGLHEKLEWDECDSQIQKFHKDFILRHIEETEIENQSYPFNI
ncbi:hypothetical protein G9C98_008581 [Cotesia typhae]|uniref:Uncharacterized protein n=1 Tax=Cotesia typhae TaxID=2053667 RepID=A0A8J5QKW4_9HYME|nr:hypothetical protein G9C98_008581 [Cotesia typhae]